MWKALVRPRGQAPAELYLSSSGAGAGGEGRGPPQLEATVEETALDLMLRATLCSC